MHRHPSLVRALALVGLGTALGSCKQFDEIYAQISGYIKEHQGYQPQSLGGSGSVSASTKVQLGRIKADGSLEIVASAAVSDGRYTIDKAPTGQRRMIV